MKESVRRGFRALEGGTSPALPEREEAGLCFTQDAGCLPAAGSSAQETCLAGRAGAGPSSPGAKRLEGAGGRAAWLLA
jgi:hypothetical protein